MNKIILLVLLVSAPALACTGFYKGERVSGMNKICFYDHLGSDAAITVNSYQVCPITVQIEH